MTLPRVLAHPPRHPYVDRLHGQVAELVHRNEPMPRLDRFHDPAWVRASAGDWDLVHLHFGHEQHPPERLLAVLDAHRAAGRPVVLTVHDLAVPHLHPAEDGSVALLAAMAPTADALVAPTTGAAGAVQDLTGQPVVVIPHGPLVPAGRRRTLRARPRQPGHVLVKAGLIRPDLGLEELAEACRLVRPHLPIRVLVDRRAAGRACAALADAPGVAVQPHDPLSHPELEDEVAAAAVLLLPYRWGTHSGMAELALDVGTPVLATDVGFLDEQVGGAAARPRPVRTAGHRVDVADLAAALGGPLGGTAVAEADRAAAGVAFLEGHRRLYAGLLAARGRSAA